MGAEASPGDYEVGVVRNPDVPEADEGPVHCRPTLQVVAVSFPGPGNAAIGSLVCASARLGGCSSACSLGKLGIDLPAALQALQKGVHVPQTGLVQP